MIFDTVRRQESVRLNGGSSRANIADLRLTKANDEYNQLQDLYFETDRAHKCINNNESFEHVAVDFYFSTCRVKNTFIEKT